MPKKKATKKKMKACPFCGEVQNLTTGYAWGESGDAGFVVACGDSCCLGPLKKTKSAAITAWNKRKAITT